MDNPVQVTFRGVSIANSESSFTSTGAFVILPRSSRYRAWESFVTLVCYVTCLLIPFQACFDSKLTVLWVLTYLFDALFLIDIVLRFFVAYYHKATLITDRERIRRQYLRGRFVIDLLSILPLDVFVFLHSGMVWYQMLSYLRLNRMLRFHRIMNYFGKFLFRFFFFVG